MAITLLNKTGFDAQYLVLKGEQIIASLPPVPPNGSATIPTTNNYTVGASITINGVLYTSGPIRGSRGRGFMVQITQDSSQQVYVFQMIEIASSEPNELQFKKTCLPDVVFTIYKDNIALQTITLTNRVMKKSLKLDDTFYISAIINGVTTDVTTTNNPNATITAVNDTSSAVQGYYTLLVSN